MLQESSATVYNQSFALLSISALLTSLTQGFKDFWNVPRSFYKNVAADFKITIYLPENSKQLCTIMRERIWNYAEAAVSFLQKANIHITLYTCFLHIILCLKFEIH